MRVSGTYSCVSVRLASQTMPLAPAASGSSNSTMKTAAR
ncbi:Uncharacterised protein [Mycobacteroides abscessus subsp. abscessus]|nr:Uncharacterised protein [Mycobacteroides abscessus subsp. abscessus]